MPTSAAEGREWVTNRIADTTAETIVDVGPGEGTYSILGRHLRLDARWLGVEIFEPYVERFMLGQKYDDIVVADIRDWVPVLGDYVILFGDVIEHLPRADAEHLVKWHQRFCEEMMVSVPIVDSPQGACFGNDHETHLHQWTFEEMSELVGECESWRGRQVGRWWWKRNPEA